MYCRLELKWLQAKSIRKVSFVLCVVDDVVKLGGGASERVQIFILAEGQKMAISGRQSILVQPFCESCVHFDFTIYPST